MGKDTCLVRRYWDEISSVYDLFIKLYFYPLYSFLKDEILSEIREEDTVLEIASGSGMFSKEISERCKAFFAIDISERMLLKLRSKSVSVLNMDASFLGFKNSVFDKVICVNGLHVFEDPLLALKEAKRVLKKGGHFISATFCYGDIRAVCFKMFLLFSGWFFMAKGIPPFLHQFDIHSLLSVFEKAGLKVISKRLLWLSPPLFYVKAIKID